MDTNIFSSARFVHLLKRDLQFNQQKTLLVVAAVLGILLIIVFSQLFDRDNDLLTFHQNAFPISMMIGGFLFTSYCFRELDHQQSAQLYLTLPVSNFERFASKWLITTFLYTIFAVVVYWIFALLIGLAASKFADLQMLPFSPFDHPHSLIIRLYLVLQSVFLLGAISFQRFSWVKTSLALIGIGIAMAILAALIFCIIFYDHFEGWQLNFEQQNSVPSTEIEGLMEGPFTSIIKVLFWAVMPLLLWTVSYFKIKEKEI